MFLDMVLLSLPNNRRCSDMFLDMVLLSLPNNRRRSDTGMFLDMLPVLLSLVPRRGEGTIFMGLCRLT